MDEQARENEFSGPVLLGMNMKTVAIIPAGGAGKRLGTDIPKQYLEINTLPVLVHTLTVFQKSDIVQEIVLVVPEKDLLSFRRQFIEPYHLTKVSMVVPGGKERQDSVRHGLRSVEPPCDIVIVHDGVRPFVTAEMIARVVKAAEESGAASVGVKAKDTIKQTTETDVVIATLPRGNLWQTQTPQAFRYEILCRAYEQAAKDKYYGTDDASLVERIGVKVLMIAGSYENIKITTPEDLLMAKAFTKGKGRAKLMGRSGLGYDSHRFAAGRKLILGGVEIPFDRGLAGHSDADALVHAVCDALLGMAGAGDIGRHFPDNDPAYKDISSLILLERVKKIVESKRMTIHNVDVTVMMEKPRLAPHAAAMTTNIAKVLNIEEAAVNIKAKTNEGMGFVGREEGVAVLAIAHGAERVKNG